ncbi:hypothetical protein INH39_02860 [Massilia violaceinigra]|uniref:Uncharacterized protein n=1 Tax=Massilia violaceinigra TaxID=2045208 RepID=A0ABY4AAL3_9BURK|nr:hypothetical protein [Massilia violaceinigra]UOD30704.1 hypothetical protein INH39_02860 [Massilia violaceinigra]
MTKTVQGSLDGQTVRKLEEGFQYDTVNSPRGVRLALYHIKQGVAVAAPAHADTTPAGKKPVRKK